LPSYDDSKEVRMLDLGANVNSPPETLLQFALMGSVAASELDAIDNPRIGLLNIGEEAHKGDDVIKKTAQLLTACPHLNYTGYIEPHKIYSNHVDVIVCDGFIGNISLKSIEGTARLIKHFIEKSYKASWYSKLMALLSWPIMTQMKQDMSTSKRNGASMIGLNGIVIKSHGAADVTAFANAIKNAYDEGQRRIPEQIAERVSSLIV
jgi:phosphate acyltransferase